MICSSLDWEVILCGALRISALSALKGSRNAEAAEIRRGPQRNPTHEHMVRYPIWICLFLILLAPSATLAANPISLDGLWRFELDPGDAGVQQQWFNRPLRQYIQLPGILQSQFPFLPPIGTDTPWVLSLYDRYWYLREDYKAYTERGKVKVPFMSQPQRHYLGPAWYQRDIEIPRYMQGRRVVLTLERPHWETTVWIDERKIGSERSLVAPHVYDLGTLALGRHRLTIRVDNRMLMPYRPDAHSVSDSLGATWNGIVGKIQIEDTGRVWIDDAQVFPNLRQHSMLIKVKIGNATGRSGQATLTAIWPDIVVAPVSWDENGGTAEIEVPIRIDAEKWDEFHPKKVPLKLWLKGTDVEEYKDLTVGLRDFYADGYLVSTFAPQKIEFSRTVSAKYLKLVSLSGFGPDKTTSLAELAVIYAGPRMNTDTSNIEYHRNRSATPDIDEVTGAPKARPSPKP